MFRKIKFCDIGSENDAELLEKNMRQFRDKLQKFFFANFRINLTREKMLNFLEFHSLFSTTGMQKNDIFAN